MNIKRNKLFSVLAFFLIGMAVPAISFAAAVSAECAYTDVDLVCYIYADTEGASLVSGGVNLNYNSFELATPTVTKNETDWYFGDGTTNHPYMNPETSTAGQVIYIVGKLDEAAPTDGVNGTRVLVGTATFARNTTTPPGPDPETFFGISTGLGRTTGTYVNFVDVNNPTADVDGAATFAANVAERGDADGNGDINSIDLQVAFGIFTGSMPWNVFADCDGNGDINSLDFQCIAAKFFGG